MCPDCPPPTHTPCFVCLQGIFVEKHFEPDAQLSFSLVEEDPVTKQPVRMRGGTQEGLWGGGTQARGGGYI